jgi:hypothetical protein
MKIVAYQMRELNIVNNGGKDLLYGTIEYNRNN